MVKKPCEQYEIDKSICPEPGNCFKCQISKADCSYWWMVEAMSVVSEQYFYKCNNCGEFFSSSQKVKSPGALLSLPGAFVKCPKCGSKDIDESEDIDDKPSSDHTWG